MQQTGELKRRRALAAVQAVTQTELDQAQDSVAGLTHARDAARARLELLIGGARPESLAALGNEIAGLDAQRHLPSDRVSQLGVVAPHGGVVTTPKLKERMGEYLKTGDLIAKVFAVDTVLADISVPEREIGDVRLGQPGTLRLRAFPERAFGGRVTTIAPAAELTPASGSFA